jgi:50S ribosomal subunit-associated GTPase HflX
VGLEDLLARIDAVLPGDPLVHLHLRVPLSKGRDLSIIHACGRVLKSDVEGDNIEIEAELPESIARQMREYVAGAELAEEPQGND